MPVEGVSLVRRLKAQPEQVFAAWTQPELMARWFFPDRRWTATINSELRVGGRWEVSMRDEAGTLHNQFGEYKEIVLASRLVFTWSCPNLGVTDSVVTVELIARGSGTELRLTHELPPDPNVRRGHEEGWQGCLGSLEAMLEEA